MRASRQRLGMGVFAALATLTLAREVSAAPSSAQSAHWYVETIGSACEDQRIAFEREITLACNAVGGTCRVAASPAEAELRAVIDCSGLDESSWTLITRTIDGTVLASLDLSGPPNDRLREAAVEVARDVAPEQVLATDMLRFTLTKEEPVHPPPQAERLTLVVGGRISSESDGDAQRSTGGLHLLGGYALAKSTRITLGVAGDAGGNGSDAVRAIRGGAGIAFGAPFDAAAPMGFAAEGGAAGTSTYGPARTAGGGGLLSTRTIAAAYCQGTVTVQWPRTGLRPYAALSAAALSDGLHIVASGEMGLALALF